MEKTPQKFVSRGGLKLAHALDEFQIDVHGMNCVDLGCNVGGFTDCLLQRGAAHVLAIDTGYGTLDWKLRSDPRVTTLERTNALHVSPAELNSKKKIPRTIFSCVDLVTIDLGWTPQRHAIPAALKWLKTAPDDSTVNSRGGGGGNSGGGHIITLIKPHYELFDDERRELLQDGKLDEETAERIVQRTLNDMPSLGVTVVNHTRSPILGGASKGKAGNIEYLALCRPQ